GIGRAAVADAAAERAVRMDAAAGLVDARPGARGAARGGDPRDGRARNGAGGGAARHAARDHDLAQCVGLPLLPGRRVQDGGLPAALAAGGEPLRADQLRDRRPAPGALLSRPGGLRTRPAGADGVRGVVDRAGVHTAGAGMEACMTARRRLLVVCFTLLGCDADPARSVKIVARPIPAAEPTAGVGWGPEYQWRPELCPPPPEPSGGPSTLVATGACAFRQLGMMECTSTEDDFILQMTRPAAREAKLLIYV